MILLLKIQLQCLLRKLRLILHLGLQADQGPFYPISMVRVSVLSTRRRRRIQSEFYGSFQAPRWYSARTLLWTFHPAL